MTPVLGECDGHSGLASAGFDAHEQVHQMQPTDVEEGVVIGLFEERLCGHGRLQSGTGVLPLLQAHGQIRFALLNPAAPEQTDLFGFNVLPQVCRRLTKGLLRLGILRLPRMGDRLPAQVAHGQILRMGLCR